MRDVVPEDGFGKRQPFACVPQRSDIAASRRQKTLYHNPPADIIAANIRDFAAGRKVTFNIPIDAAGRINPAPLAQPRG